MMRTFWLMTAVVATLRTSPIYSDDAKLHLSTPASEPTKTRSISVIEDKKGAPTEPARTLPLENRPILECDSKDKKFTVTFEREKGFAAANIYEKKSLQATLDCGPSVKQDSLYFLECHSDEFQVKFTYPQYGKISGGDLAEVSGGHASAAKRLICRD